MLHIPSFATFSCLLQEPQFTPPVLFSLFVWLWEEAEFQTALTISDFNLSSKTRLVSSLSKNQDENFPVLLWVCLSFQENSLHMMLHCLGRNNQVIFSVLQYLVSYLSLHCGHQKLICIYLHSVLQENFFSLVVLLLNLLCKTLIQCEPLIKCNDIIFHWVCFQFYHCEGASDQLSILNI